MVRTSFWFAIAVFGALALIQQTAAYTPDQDVAEDDTGFVTSGDIWVRVWSTESIPTGTSGDINRATMHMYVENGGDEPTAGAMTGASTQLLDKSLWANWTPDGEGEGDWTVKFVWYFDPASWGESKVADGCEFVGVYDVKMREIKGKVDGIEVTSAQDRAYADVLVDNDMMPHGSGGPGGGSYSDTYSDSQAPTVLIEAVGDGIGSWVGENDYEDTYFHKVNGGQLGGNHAVTSAKLRVRVDKPK